MILVDASILIAYFSPKTPEERKLRLRGLFETLDKARLRIVVPTPALCEFIALAGDAAEEYRQWIARSRAIQIAPFGVRACNECAIMIRQAKTAGDKRNEAATWAKAKFDWQIMAIAKAEGVTTVYAEDGDLVRLGKRFGITVQRIDDLPIPENLKQRALALNPSRKRP